MSWIIGTNVLYFNDITNYDFKLLIVNIETYRNYCLAKLGVTEEFPFDEKALVFKVMGKMFTITDVDKFESFNVKCDPELAIELRERYVGVLPEYHMSKKHWNTIMMDGFLKIWP